MRDGSKIHVAVPAVPLSLPLKRPLCTISFSANRACMITVRFRPRLPVSAAAPGPVYNICHTALHRPAALCNGMDAAFSPSLHLQWFYFSGFLGECQVLFLQNSQREKFNSQMQQLFAYIFVHFIAPQQSRQHSLFCWQPVITPILLHRL